jgi:FkbM family methyltransferase
MTVTLKPPTKAADSMRTVVLSLNGKEVTLQLDSNLPTQRYIYEVSVAGALYEEQSTLALVRNLQPGDTFIDVGANCGWFSAIASTLGAKVIAVEPSEQNIASLRRNAPKADVVEGVMTNYAGLARLFVNLDNDGGHCLWECGKHSHNTATVAADNPTQVVCAYRLDSLAGHNPNIIKIDTEGAECNVLLGAEKVLSGPALRMVICERHDMGLELMGHSAEEVLAIMTRHGFRDVATCEGDTVQNWIFVR